jgi:hypothetical protein
MQVLGRSVPLRLVKESDGFDLHIVSFGEEDDRPGTEPRDHASSGEEEGLG